MKESNRLITETSPYLLQHAYNPVDWYPWGDEAWDRARRENKLVLVSVGYSACHWCHVMEREVFENEACAALMNDRFICIKVDREERPDVDHVYMLAVQLMTRQGGWPLNCFCLPDKRPVYGGTYFPAQRWMNVLKNLDELFTTRPSEMEEYAQHLGAGIQQLDQFADQPDSDFNIEFVRSSVDRWRGQWDRQLGGNARAPKFPMPTNIRLLLHTGVLFSDVDATGHAILTLRKMAFGGIYDQLGGGFARYSVDALWKVPHFEKMLYDNAQLITAYSEALRCCREEKLFERIIRETICFVERELTSPDGLCYSALDADTDGEEGLFYVWSGEDLSALSAENAAFAKTVFGIDADGYWEHGRSVLVRPLDDRHAASALGMTEDVFSGRLEEVKAQMLNLRSNRTRPGLDDKILTSWNALMIRAYCDAWKALGEDEYLLRAKKMMQRLLEVSAPGAVIHHTTACKDPGFIEDAAFVIEALICIYECTGETGFLQEAELRMEQTIDSFLDDSNGLFWFTRAGNQDLFTRKKELEDNVIPSANSSLCKSLMILGHHFDRTAWREHSRRMLRNVHGSMDHVAAWSNWLEAYLWNAAEIREVVFTGPGAMHELKAWFLGGYRPQSLVAASTTERSLPLFRNRQGIETAIYVCTGHTCLAPVPDAVHALKQTL